MVEAAGAYPFLPRRWERQQQATIVTVALWLKLLKNPVDVAE